MKTLFIILVLIYIPKAFSHPVIYKNGIVLSSFNMKPASNEELMYSFSNRFATGFNYWRLTKNNDTTEFYFAKLNHLLWRDNGENSQSNIYLHAGAGEAISKIENKDNKLGYMAGIEADSETRTLYGAMKYYYLYSPQVTNMSVAQLRLGFSPIHTPFDQLQTWFMMQFMYMPQVNKTVSVTPMLRFFYHNVLWEMGSSTKGDWMLNLMVHY